MLEWKTTDIKNQHTACFEETGEDLQMRQVTRQLIFFTERVGLNRITNDNRIDFWKRVNAWERVHGQCLSRRGDDDKPIMRFISLQEVQDHVGLWTNARRLTEPKFYDEIIKTILCDVDEKLANEQRACETLPT